MILAHKPRTADSRTLQHGRGRIAPLYLRLFLRPVRAKCFVHVREIFRGCKKAGVKPRFIDFKGKDPLAFVISENVHRRHLDETQRAMIARRMVTTKKGGQGKANSSIELFDQKAAAGLFNVAVASIKRAGIVIDKGTPELVRACDRGEVAVSAIPLVC